MTQVPPMEAVEAPKKRLPALRRAGVFLWRFFERRVLVKRFEVVLHPRFFPL